MIEEAARSSLFSSERTAAMLILARDMRVHDLHLKEDPGPVIQFLSAKTSVSVEVTDHQEAPYGHVLIR
jgi:hypothetical protein